MHATENGGSGGKFRRTIVIGLEGCSWSLLEPLLETGELPRLAELAGTAARGVLESTIPFSASPAWASLATGSTPLSHGIHDSLLLRGAELVPAAQGDLRLTPYYQQLGREGGASVVVNLPLDHTGCEGAVIVNGGVSPDARRLLPVGRRERYVRLLEVYRVEPRNPTSLDELCKVEQARFDLARELFLGEHWNHFLLRFSEPGLLARAEGGALHAGDTRTRDRFLRLYRQLDRHIGWLADRADDALVAIVAVNGSEAEQRVLNINAFLADEGLAAGEAIRRLLEASRPRLRVLRLPPPFGRTGFGRPAPEGADPATPDGAFAPTDDGLAIYVRGQIDPEAVRSALLELRAPDGAPLVADVWRFDELRGRAPEAGEPTLLVQPTPGTTVSAALAGPIVAPGRAQAGTASRDGLILLTGEHVETCDLGRVSICDVAPTLLWAMRAGIPREIDGRILFEAFGGDFATSQPVREIDAPGRAPDSGKVTARLRALGYL